MTAKFSGEASFLVVQRSSSNVTSSVQWKSDPPMGVRCDEDGLGVGFEGRDVEAGLEAFAPGLLVDAPGEDGGDGTQIFPVGVAFGEPACLSGPATALFDPAVTGVGLGARCALCGADRIGEEQRRVLMQAGLIAFEREDIVRAFVDDAPGDLRLAPMASIDTIAPLRLTLSRSSGIAVISLDFPSTACWASNQSCLGGVSGNQMQRALPVRRRLRAGAASCRPRK